MIKHLFHFLLDVTPQLSPKAMRWVLIWATLAFLLSLLLVSADFFEWQGALLELVKYGFFGASVLFFGLFLADYAQVLWLKFGLKLHEQIAIERHLPSNLSVFRPILVKLVIRHAKLARGVSLWFMDFYPTHCKADFLPIHLSANDLNASDDTEGLVADNQTFSTRLKPNALKSDNALHDGAIQSEMMYELTPTRRGHAEFGGVDVRFTGCFGLLSLTAHIPSSRVAGTQKTRVLADFKEVFSGNLYAIAQKSAIGGLIHRRQRGQGQDFHQIRSYIEGDSIRHIDWRATARQGKLMTREFQDEQDQQIMFLLDASQNMRHLRSHSDDGTRQSSHLDMALGAMLLLANIAKEQGDATGFISFSGLNDKIAPPKKGEAVLSYLLNQSFDVHSSLLMPDYIAAAKSLLSIQKKRSLVILITNHKSQEASELIDAIHLLRGKHMVVVASLYEEDLALFLNESPNNAEAAMTYHSIYDHLNRQDSLTAKLKEVSHVQTLNCTPSQLPSLLVQTYLTLKRRHAI